MVLAQFSDFIAIFHEFYTKIDFYFIFMIVSHLLIHMLRQHSETIKPQFSTKLYCTLILTKTI